jgi:ATP-dependent exoDNAse (exonuclease V) beta subunit
LSTALASGKVQLELHREQSFAVRLDDAIVQGSFDRLLLFRHADKVLAIDILDFKTDRVDDPEQLARRIEFYRPQLEEYRRAAAKQYQLDAGRVAARLLFVSQGELRVIRPNS